MTAYALTKVLSKVNTLFNNYHKNSYITIITKSRKSFNTTYVSFLDCNDTRENKYEYSNPPIIIVNDEHTIYINLEDIESIII